MMKSLQSRIYDILAVSEHRGDASWYVDMAIIILIGLNTAAMIAESMQPIHQQFERELYVFEVISVVIFSVEYLLRLWTANIHPAFARPFWGNLRYAATPLAMIDLLAVAPFFLPFLGVDLRVIRILRVFRLLRLFKVARYVRALSIITEVVRKKREELTISLVFTFLLLLIASSLVYFVEHEAQGDKFASIPETMWWGIATLTTVGYGDIYPITPLGKLLGGLIAIIGIGLFALPAGLLASGFAEALATRTINAHKEEQTHPHLHSIQTQASTEHSTERPLNVRVCPHCGRVLDEDG